MASGCISQQYKWQISVCDYCLYQLYSTAHSQPHLNTWRAHISKLFLQVHTEYCPLAMLSDSQLQLLHSDKYQTLGMAYVLLPLASDSCRTTCTQGKPHFRVGHPLQAWHQHRHVLLTQIYRCILQGKQSEVLIQPHPHECTWNKAGEWLNNAHPRRCVWTTLDHIQKLDWSKVYICLPGIHGFLNSSTLQ